jgi:hypothetical protein
MLLLSEKQARYLGLPRPRILVCDTHSRMHLSTSSMAVTPPTPPILFSLHAGLLRSAVERIGLALVILDTSDLVDGCSVASCPARPGQTRAGGLWTEDFQGGNKVFVLEVTSKRRTPSVMLAARDRPRKEEKGSHNRALIPEAAHTAVVGGERQAHKLLGGAPCRDELNTPDPSPPPWLRGSAGDR